MEKNREGLLYPFIGAWNQRLVEVAGLNFQKLRDFRNEIISTLRDWITIPQYQSASYYQGLFRLRDEYNFPLRVFSLNYDLCLEKVAGVRPIETGFDPANRTWDGRRFESREEDAPAVYLYKLHGSISWYREEAAGNVLKEAESPPAVSDIIFGTDYKMQYIDPYLFYAYELRRWSLEAQVILAIGYSFRDPHINGIIEQALRNNQRRMLVAVSPEAPSEVKRLRNCSSQCVHEAANAKKFLSSVSVSKLEQLAGIRDVPGDGF
ncbi:MAG TPA: SIR2 family protein [Candidatus Eisenbacteria bacterium]|nr:SIR2 family protein [Candidatus Eisenbacteria bacterium]